MISIFIYYLLKNLSEHMAGYGIQNRVMPVTAPLAI